MDVKNYYKVTKEHSVRIEKIGFYDADYFHDLNSAADHRQIHWLPKANDGDDYLMKCFISVSEAIANGINKKLKYVLLLEDGKLVQPNFDDVFSTIK